MENILQSPIISSPSYGFAGNMMISTKRLKDNNEYAIVRSDPSRKVENQTQTGSECLLTVRFAPDIVCIYERSLHFDHNSFHFMIKIRMGSNVVDFILNKCTVEANLTVWRVISFFLTGNPAIVESNHKLMSDFFDQLTWSMSPQGEKINPR